MSNYMSLVLAICFLLSGLLFIDGISKSAGSILIINSIIFACFFVHDLINSLYKYKKR